MQHRVSEFLAFHSRFVVGCKRRLRMHFRGDQHLALLDKKKEIVRRGVALENLTTCTDNWSSCERQPIRKNELLA